MLRASRGYLRRTWWKLGYILGLSWEDLGAIGVHLGASCAMLGQSWGNLEATWFNLGGHSLCEMRNVNFILVLSVFFEVLLANTCDM